MPDGSASPGSGEPTDERRRPTDPSSSGEILALDAGSAPTGALGVSMAATGLLGPGSAPSAPLDPAFAPTRTPGTWNAPTGLLGPGSADLDPAFAPTQVPRAVVLAPEDEFKVRFEVVEGPLTGRAFAPASRTFVVGRLREAPVSLHGDTAVSRRHCLVQVCPPRARLRDLSKNGTRVDGRRLDGADVDLIDGSLLRIGRSTLRFHMSGGPSPPQAARPIGAWCPPGLAIVRELGRGGLGVVYEGRRADGQRVAVKTMIPQTAASAATLARFLREAEVGARIDHPAAVRVFEAGMHAGAAFFVMELVEGTDAARELAARARPFSVVKATKIIRTILGAVGAAHRRGLVHRDIKPANILLQRVERGFVPRLADFGLMRCFETAGLTYTGTGEGMGTPGFMPPEQVEDARNVGPAADVYAVGATLYNLLTRAVPVDLGGAPHPLLAVVESPRIPLLDRLPDAPRALARVVDACVALAPEERPASADELDRLLAEAVP